MEPVRRVTLLEEAHKQMLLGIIRVVDYININQLGYRRPL
jgi:hypothetical protein